MNSKRILSFFFMLFLLISVDVQAKDGEVLKIDKAQFKAMVMDYEKNPKEWKFAGKLPCVIDFYADWCGPCKTASPILEELALKYKGKLLIYKVNTDQERELSTVFGISGIPAFLWVPQQGNPIMTSGVGKSVEETKDQFEKIIQEQLKVK
ncbi:MAG: thioredoxin domain-containing protein [Bacteroidia bacterium]|nr:thioredoxin domain-containing protein [Bacteroidia bacterium]